MTLVRTPELWDKIATILIDERELIRNTFPKIIGAGSSDTFGKCWCGYRSLVKIVRHDDKSSTFFCNFHYRKLFFRYLSNGRHLEEDYSIIDEREKLEMSVSEEAEQLTLI